jgi:ZIP family zinc transporter
MAEEIQRTEEKGEEWKGNGSCDDDNCASDCKEKEEKGCEDSNCADSNCDDDASAEEKEDENKDVDHTKDSAKLMRMSINTAIAIGLHNFPEGLATFVATLNDPGVGMVLAVAIAIHNIPEGLCVAMPIYYATGNRWKAFGWALFSGLAEPFAALLGWIVLANSFNDKIYGALFGLVAGMMIIISVRELLPTAHRYDPEDSVVTYSFMAGMGIMALSLVLFKL